VKLTTVHIAVKTSFIAVI